MREAATSNGTGRADESGASGFPRLLILLSAGVASAALYLIVLEMQRAISRNGLNSATPLVDPGYLADRSALLWQSGLYLFSTLALFALYGFLLFLCYRGEMKGKAVKALAWGFPVLFNLLLLPGAPHLSQDVWSYMAHGYLGLSADGNPFRLPASVVGDTAFGHQLEANGWRPETGIGVTPYGVLWTRLEMAAVGIAGDARGALLLLKALVVAASFGTALLIWRFLAMTNPRFQMLGALAYLWNPLIVVEFAGEGHNDAVLIVFVLASLVACAAERPTLSVASLLMGVMIKYIPALFLPALLACLWRQRQATSRLALQLLLGLLFAVGVAAVLYGPLWFGPDTLRGLQSRAQPISSASPAGLVNWVLMRTPLRALSGQLTLALVAAPALAFMLWASFRAKDAAGLARAFAQVSLAFVLVAAPDYWPWYVGLPVALAAAASPDRLLLGIAFLLSLIGRLCAPLDVMFENGFIPFPVAKALTTGLGVTLPLLVLAAWGLLAWRRRTRPELLRA